jgi:hypothetical protein
MELMNLDWPNLLAGLILSAISGAFVLLVKYGYQYFKSARDLPQITGIWHSAEYDVKGHLPHDNMIIQFMDIGYCVAKKLIWKK